MAGSNLAATRLNILMFDVRCPHENRRGCELLTVQSLAPMVSAGSPHVSMSVCVFSRRHAKQNGYVQTTPYSTNRPTNNFHVVIRSRTIEAGRNHQPLRSGVLGTLSKGTARCDPPWQAFQVSGTERVLTLSDNVVDVVEAGEWSDWDHAQESEHSGTT